MGPVAPVRVIVASQVRVKTWGHLNKLEELNKVKIME